MVKPGAVVIDVGINAVADASSPGGTRIVGDVDPEVASVAACLTPVPGGVGPVTVAMLMRNTVWAARGIPSADDPSQLPLFHA
jgi:5,10-methylene-tetrahydrofolate dehydrogenase/methenyl tetrahydrofolate cyclohydrolase